MKAGSVLGTTLGPLELVPERRKLHKLLNIMDNTSHQLHDLLVSLQCAFQARVLYLWCNKHRDKMSILMTPFCARRGNLSSEVFTMILHFKNKEITQNRGKPLDG